MSWSHDIEGQPAVPRVIGADLSPYPYSPDLVWRNG